MSGYTSHTMPFGLFKSIKSSTASLGLDIGTSAIKIVELDKKSGRFSLNNYGIFELKGSSSAKSLAVNQSVQSLEAWQSILKMPDQEIVNGIEELIKKADIKSTDVVASIPSFSTFATVIEMPYTSNEDLARAIPFEAKKYVPIPLDEVILDWSIVGVANSGQLSGIFAKPSMVEIFLAAVPRDETTRYQNIMKSVGLNMRALELENSALIRSLLGNDLSCNAIVNIGGRSTSIMIVNKGYERISHNYEIGGFEITKAISQSLGVGLEKAEDLKRKFGLKKGEENIVTDSVISLVDMMIFETQKTVANYEKSKKEKAANVILIGGLINMPGFSDYFKERLNYSVIVGDPFSRVAYPEGLGQIIPELRSTLAIAVGLAMRET